MFLAALNESKFTIFNSVFVILGHAKSCSEGSCSEIKFDSRDAPVVSAVTEAERAMVSLATFCLSWRDGAILK